MLLLWTKFLTEIVTLLIQNGADIIGKNKIYGLTPLLYAAFAGYDESVELLIKNGANICVRDSSENTPLHLASNSKTAEILIQNGASMVAKDHYEFTPFEKAVNNGNVELVKTFIKHGADVCRTNNSHETPLHFCSDSRIAEILIANGADHSEHGVLIGK